MKKYILFSLIIVSLILAPAIIKAQIAKSDNDTILTFTRIVQMDSMNQAKIFARANEWFIKRTYNKSKSFINENSTGKLETDAFLFTAGSGPSFPTMDYGEVHCKIIFIAKDNKYKVSLLDFYHVALGDLNTEKPNKVMGFRLKQEKWIKMKQDAINIADKVLEEFLAFMNDKSDSDF